MYGFERSRSFSVNPPTSHAARLLFTRSWGRKYTRPFPLEAAVVLRIFTASFRSDAVMLYSTTPLSFWLYVARPVIRSGDPDCTRETPLICQPSRALREITLPCPKNRLPGPT